MFGIMPTISEIQSFDKDQIRDFIARAEVIMKESGGELEIPHTDRFSKGVYCREITIPKDTFLIGKIHKFENLNILSKGKLSIISIEGCQTVEAPFTIVSPPGVKRFAYAHEDSVWSTIHGTDETDVDKIEEIFIAKDYSEVIEHKETLKIEGV